MLTTKLFGSSVFSTVVLASVLTPELTTGLSILIAAIFVGLVNLYMARTARMVAMKEVAKVIAPIEEKVTKIEAHVNSDKTRDTGTIAAQAQQIEMQAKVIEDLKAAAAILANAKAMSEMAAAISGAAVAGATTPPAAPVAHAPSVAASLDRIDGNTERTADNTQRQTEAVVQDLKDKA